MRYGITATVSVVTVDKHGVRWRGMRQVPYFILDSDVQGIVDAKHAQRIAIDILSAAQGNEEVEYSVTAAPLAPRL